MIKSIHGQILPSLLCDIDNELYLRALVRAVTTRRCKVLRAWLRLVSLVSTLDLSSCRLFQKTVDTSKVVRLLTTPTACCARDTVAISFSPKYDIVQNPTPPYPYVFQTAVILGDALCRFPIRYTASRPRTIQKSTLDKGLPTPVRT